MSEDDDDIGATFRALRLASQEKRARNREHGATLLKEAAIPFEERNGGAHLIVGHPGYIYDYWPGTGYWKSRETGISRRGILKLIAKIQREGLTARSHLSE